MTFVCRHNRLKARKGAEPQIKLRDHKFYVVEGNFLQAHRPSRLIPLAIIFPSGDLMRRKESPIFQAAGSPSALKADWFGFTAIPHMLTNLITRPE